MTTLECLREPEVVRAVLARRWPDGVDEELRTHAEACATCAEVAIVGAALAHEREEAFSEVHLPAAGQVWWRAALRAHAEAAEAASRPMVWLHGIAGAAAAGVGAAMIALGWPWIGEAASWIAAFASALEVDAPNMTMMMETLRRHVPLAVTLLACLVLTPLAVYFALSDD